MSAKRAVVSLAIVLGCKGDGKDRKAPRPVEGPQAPLEEALPAHFPLPASQTRKLARSQSRLAMSVWEYEYADLEAKDAAAKIHDGMIANGYAVTAREPELVGTYGGRTYVVAVRALASSTVVAIRSFPEAGPTTLPAPTSYPAAFPFVAGGTASHAPAGGKLQIAYTSEAHDLELAMTMAARAAGWQCAGTGTVTCTKDRSTVTFATEPAPGGSLLLVTVP